MLELQSWHDMSEAEYEYRLEDAPANPRCHWCGLAVAETDPQVRETQQGVSWVFHAECFESHADRTPTSVRETRVTRIVEVK